MKKTNDYTRGSVMSSRTVLCTHTLNASVPHIEDGICKCIHKCVLMHRAKPF